MNPSSTNRLSLAARRPDSAGTALYLASDHFRCMAGEAVDPDAVSVLG